MRRVVSISLAVTLLLTTVTGLAENHVHPGQSGIHNVFAFLMIAAAVVHFILNFKAFMRYLGSSSRKAPSKSA